MHVLFDFLYAYPWIALLQGAFTVWMAVDAYRRGAEQYWLFVVLLVPAAGAWVYFFVYPGPDLATRTGPLFARRVSLDELEYRAEQSPTLANHLALAQELVRREAYADAFPPLEAAHKIEPEHRQVLFCMAVCHAKLAAPDRAVPLLERIVQHEPRWSDYQAWQFLIELRALRGESEAALGLARELVRLSPTLKHSCLLGELLGEHGHGAEARVLLERALQDHAYQPPPIRRREKSWAGQARKLLRRLPSKTAAD